MSNTTVARIATGHLQLLQRVHMSTYEYVILGSAFKSWVAYIVGLKGKALLLGALVFSAFLYHCCSSVCHFPWLLTVRSVKEKAEKKHVTG